MSSQVYCNNFMQLKCLLAPCSHLLPWPLLELACVDTRSQGIHSLACRTLGHGETF